MSPALDRGGPILSAALGVAAACMLGGASGCEKGRLTDSPGTETGSAFTVVFYHLEPPHAPASPDEVGRKAAEVLAALDPDVVALLSTGAADSLPALFSTLARTGHPYPEIAALPATSDRHAVAVLSRLPVTARRFETNAVYHIDAQRLHTSTGFLDVEMVAGGKYIFRLVVAGLKDKTYHPLGQTEMRRNEARLLAKYLRRAAGSTPGMKLLVAAALNDYPQAAPVRELCETDAPALTDLRPADGLGDCWTSYDPGIDAYSRACYLLASAELRPNVLEADTRVANLPLTREVSLHRPLVTVIRCDGP